MRHAYLIIAHSNWEQLKTLLQLLDEVNNAIYIHIDAKATDVPMVDLQKAVKKAQIRLYQKYKVYWGSFELVQVELLLFREAHKKHYDYYHLLSGADLPIKTQEEINLFFEKNNGFEFVQYDTDERLKKDKEIGRRTKLYHFLQNYRRRYNWKPLNSFFTLLERILLAVQLLLRIDRMKKYQNVVIKYGSQWVSITDDLAEYLLQNEPLIYNLFHCTNCADELFIQTLVYNSEFRNRLYDKDFDDDIRGNMRLIDMKKRGKNGNPYTWKIADIEEIKQSKCLFARKFDSNVDTEVISAVCKLIREGEKE